MQKLFFSISLICVFFAQFAQASSFCRPFHIVGFSHSRAERSGAIVPGRSKPDFVFPARSKVFTFPPKHVVLAERDSRAHEGRVDPEAMQMYLENLDKIRSQIKDKVQNLDSIQTVFYPAIGTDAALPVRVFPNARMYIGLDMHPFLTPWRIKNAPSFEYVNGMVGGVTSLGWRRSTGVDSEGCVGRRIVGSLMQAVPNFRLLNITVYAIDPYTEKNWDGKKSINYKEIHGVIEFDQGEGTTPQKFIQLNDDIPSKETSKEGLEKLWWMKQMKLNSPEGILIKGSVDAASTTAINDDFRSLLIASVKKKNGIILEDVSQFSDTSKIKHPKVRLSFSLHPDEFSEAKHVYIEDVPYGYHHSVFVTGFGK